jgi:hypothetical protein
MLKIDLNFIAVTMRFFRALIHDLHPAENIDDCHPVCTGTGHGQIFKPSS